MDFIPSIRHKAHAADIVLIDVVFKLEQDGSAAPVKDGVLHPLDLFVLLVRVLEGNLEYVLAILAHHQQVEELLHWLLSHVFGQGGFEEDLLQGQLFPREDLDLGFLERCLIDVLQPCFIFVDLTLAQLRAQVSLVEVLFDPSFLVYSILSDDADESFVLTKFEPHLAFLRLMKLSVIVKGCLFHFFNLSSWCNSIQTNQSLDAFHTLVVCRDQLLAVLLKVASIADQEVLRLIFERFDDTTSLLGVVVLDA